MNLKFLNSYIRKFLYSPIRKFKINKFTIVAFIIIVLFAPLAYLITRHPRSASAGWWDDIWHYRVQITVTNSGAADSNKKIKFDIDTETLITAGKMQADCGDSRFTAENGEELLYYLDSAVGACNTSSTDYYVLVPTIPAGNFNIYHYYGNPSATDGTQSSQFTEATFSPGSTSSAAEEKGTSPIAYWSFDEGYGTTVHNQMEKNGENGLVSWWKFDEGTGTSAGDEMGVNTGTLGADSSAPTWSTSGKIGNALSFDGNNDYVTVADSNNSLDFTGSFTISTWLYINNLPTSGNLKSIAAKWESNTGWDLRLYNNSGTQKIGFGIDGVAMDTSYTLPTSQWIHFVGVHNATDDIDYFYLNGIQIASITSSTTDASANAATTEIGRMNSTYGRYFDGQIDSVKLFNRALSASEIDSEYRSIHGQMINMSASSDWVDGVQLNSSQQVLGKALDFDGSDDYVYISNDGLLDFGSDDFSVSVWFKGTSFHSSDNGAFFEAADATGDFWPLIALRGYNNGTLEYYIRDDDADYVNATTTQTYNDNIWHNAVIVRDGTSGHLYVDGKQVLSGSDGGLDSVSTGNPWYIGRTYDSTARYINASIDEVKVFRHALSTDEIKMQYNRGVSSALDVGINVNIGATGPVGYWKLDESSAYTAFDSSGNNNTAILSSGNSAPTWAQGKIGKALDFDGNDNISIADSNSLDITSNFTIEAWVKRDAVGADHTIVAKENLDAETTGAYLFRVYTNNKLLLTIRNVADIYDTGSTTIPQGTWTHIAVAHTDTSYKFYVNGVLNSDITNANNPTANTSTLLMGRTGPALYFLDGQLDHVKIYNYARTVPQIHYDMATGSPVSYWRFDEGYGETAYDEQKNNNGTLGADSSAPTWADGAQGNTNQKPLGKSLSFDGSDDYVNVPTSSSLTYDGTTAWTMEAWVEPNDNGNNQTILSKAYDLSSHDQYIMNITDSGSNFTVWIGSHVSSDAWRVNCTTDTTYSYGVWHHIVGILGQGTNSSYIYVDGVLAKTCSTAAGVVTSAYDLKIGREERDAYPYFFNGQIDNVKIYNYALVADEVKVEYNRGGALTLGVGQNASDPGSDNLKAWWKMDEATGTSAYDISGNANTGAFGAGSSAPTWAQGKVGKALQFDGTDDYINISDSPSLTISGQNTIEFWFKPSVTINPSDPLTHILLWKGNSDTIGTANSDGRLEIRGPDPRPVSTTSTWIAGTWYHIALTLDSGGYKLYINGILEGTSTSTYSILSSSNSITIGGSPDLPSWFNGFIDHVKIYNSALTAAQIAWEYNQGKPLAHWRLDEKSDITAYDDSDNNYDATLTLMDPSTDWVAGKFNGALDFDGTNDRLVLPDFGFGESYPFTISGWFKTSEDYVDSVVIFQGRYTDSNNPAVFCGFGATEVAGYSIRNDAGTMAEFNGTTLLNDGLWHQISCVAEAANSHKLYVDGKLENSSTTNVTTPITLNLYNVGAGYYLGSYYYHLQGQIDEVKLYNYGLTADQIKVDYNNGAAVKY